MKQLFTLVLISLGFLSLNAQSNGVDTVTTFPDWEDLFQYHTYYISAQPDLEELKWLKEQGITKIVNLRTDEENKTFSKESFNEKREARKLGIDYKSLPVDGYADYTPEKLGHFLELVDPGDKVLIHCKSGGRANTLFMAYLIKDEGYSVDRAVEIGKQIRFYLPLEDLLGVQIHMEIAE